MKGRSRKRIHTPIRDALVSPSTLVSRVHDGLGAMKGHDRKYIEDRLRADFADSLDLDRAMRPRHDQENRWDYLLGYAPTVKVVGLEPHAARQDEIATVIAKRRDARNQLRSHLKPGVRIETWLWVASGRVYFADTEKARRRLDQNGIQFVGTRVHRKHLPDGGS